MKQEPLLCRIARGDTSAVSEFMDRYGGLIWWLARRSCATRADAEDAVQEIFVQLWRSAARYEPEVAAESTFVAMVARRKLIDRRRAAANPLTEPSTFEDIPADSRPTDQWLATCEEAAIATQLLEELPKDQARAIRLAVLGGLSHADIAKETGLALGTVKTHIRRGLSRLREKLRGRTACKVGAL